MNLKEQRLQTLKRRILRTLTESNDLEEGFDDDEYPDLKYYAFDWDDNIVHMPTKILVETEDGDVFGMSTEDYEIYKDKIGKTPVEYNGRIVTKFADNYLINFGEKRQNRFIPEALDAKPAPAFSDFRKAINSGSIFAIITARGLNPQIIKQAVLKYINVGFNGISKDSLLANLKKYEKIVGDESEKNDEDLIMDYLNLCKFYPVTFRNPNVNVSEEKNVKLEEFKSYIDKVSNLLKMNYELIDDVGYKEFMDREPTIGMSDDSLKNIEALLRRFGKDPSIKIISTAGGEKKKLT